MYSVWFGCKTCRRSFLKLNDLFQHKEVHPLCVEREIQRKDEDQAVSFLPPPTLFKQENILSSADDDQQQHLNANPVIYNVQESKGEEPTSTATVQVKKRNRKKFLSTPRALRKRKFVTSQEAPIQSEIQIKNDFNKSPNNLLECRFCLKPQPSKQGLILHERIHTGVQLFQCKHCVRKFTWEQACNRHQVGCKRRGSRISKGGLRYKMETLVDPPEFMSHVTKLFSEKKKLLSKKQFGSKSKISKSVMTKLTCSYCYKVFSHQSCVLVHERLHTGEKPYSCDRCDSKFRAPSELSFHLLKSRSSACSKRYISSSSLPLPAVIKQKRITTSPAPPDDILLDVKPKHVFIFNEKSNVESTIPSKNCQQVKSEPIFDSNPVILLKRLTSQKILKNRATAKANKPITLESSEKLPFGRKMHTKNHILLHFENRPFKCQELNCGKAFKRKHHLRGHLINIHSDSKPSGIHFHCAFNACEKVFRRACGLTYHFSSRHSQECSGSGSGSGNKLLKYKQCDQSDCLTSRYQRGGDKKPIKCPQPNCTKEFKFESTLRIHSAKHSKLRPYKCTVPNCNQTFKTPYIFNTHVQTHTRDLVELPLKCSLKTDS